MCIRDSPWEVLSKIEEYILKIGEELSKEDYNKVGENVWKHTINLT